MSTAEKARGLINEQDESPACGVPPSGRADGAPDGIRHPVHVGRGGRGDPKSFLSNGINNSENSIVVDCSGITSGSVLLLKSLIYS